MWLKKDNLFGNLILSLVIVFVLSSGIFVAIGAYTAITNEQRALQLYDDTLEAYKDYIDNILNHTSKSVASAFYYEQGTVYTNLFSDDALTQRMAEIQMQKYLSDKAVSTGTETMLFICDPSNHVRISNTVIGVNYLYYQNMWDTIDEQIDSQTLDNQWQLISVEGKQYFLIVLHQDAGYAGAVVNAHDFLNQMTSSAQISTQIEFSKTNAGMPQATDLNNFWFFTRSIHYLKPISNSDIFVEVSMDSFVSREDWVHYLIYLILAVFSCTLIFMMNMRRQWRQVLDPMTDLQHAMLAFSRGDIDIRLKESGNEDVDKLYKTFNQMVEQITRLKIKVYEDELEKQTIMSNYLKLQIQPHFYANILNIIYGLACLEDYHTIQILSKKTASYFRYLLAEKGTFYPLDNEVSCLKDFAGIQEIRYEDMIKFEFDIDESLYQEPVPPMILLTFMNNSVKHNITYVPHLTIIVAAERRETEMILSVTDNGRGMSREIADRIMN